jgi:xylulose-5-phosphate/fructose-6-phosphate phosphoketolase
MVVLNGMSRFHLAAEALRRSPRMRGYAPGLIDECKSLVDRAIAYSKEHLEDAPEIRDWVWSETPETS